MDRSMAAFLGISSSLASFFTRGKGSEPGILLLTSGKFKSFTLLILYLLGLRLALECGIYTTDTSGQFLVDALLCSFTGFLPLSTLTARDLCFCFGLLA